MKGIVLYEICSVQNARDVEHVFVRWNILFSCVWSAFLQAFRP